MGRDQKTDHVLKELRVHEEGKTCVSTIRAQGGKWGAQYRLAQIRSSEFGGSKMPRKTLGICLESRVHPTVCCLSSGPSCLLLFMDVPCVCCSVSSRTLDRGITYLVSVTMLAQKLPVFLKLRTGSL